jgi:hypothetical protein
LNRLQQHIHAWQRDEQEVLNKLQERRLISDLVLSAADVPDCDSIPAMGYLLATVSQQPNNQHQPTCQALTK